MELNIETIETTDFKPNVRWKQSRDYIILMNMMSFVFGMLICSIIVFIYEGGL